MPPIITARLRPARFGGLMTPLAVALGLVVLLLLPNLIMHTGLHSNTSPAMSMLGNATSKEDLPVIQAEVSEITTSGEYTRYPMAKQWPVYITYFTMASDVDGKLRSFGDLYGRDAPVLEALDAPRQSDRARKTSEEVIEIVDDLQTS